MIVPMRTIAKGLSPLQACNFNLVQQSADFLPVLDYRLPGE
jgi:hypothetical protein